MQKVPVIAIATVGVGIVLASLPAFGMRAAGKPSANEPSPIAPVWSVSDEAELERVADTELVARELQPLGGGQGVKVGWMGGLRRLYQPIDEKVGQRVLSVAFNDECDVVVAVARLDGGDAAAIAPQVIGFLNSNPTVLWAKKELGLEFVRREW
jgi:hypothetical protein